jgi:aryl-alcohol dehydrogenase-like predicted oxidoreductase
MHALNDLCTARKVLYLGISDTPAWIVVKANSYAQHHGLRPFSVYQGRWGAACRDFERDIIPMCINEGLALAPWGVLGGGGFKSKDEDEPEDRRQITFGRTGKEERVKEVLDGIAKTKGEGESVTGASVALAYVLHKAPYVFPIVGGRKTKHLKSNIEALGLALSDEEMDQIDKAYGWEIGFPHDFSNPANKFTAGPEDCASSANSGFFDYVVKAKPVPPHQGPVDQARRKAWER